MSRRTVQHKEEITASSNHLTALKIYTQDRITNCAFIRIINNSQKKGNNTIPPIRSALISVVSW
jgi:hypothetical protein